MIPSDKLLFPGLLLATCVAAQDPFRTTRHHSLPPIVYGYNVAAGDVDGDGDPDLVIANDYGPNELWLNDGRGTFVDATAGRLTTPASNASYAVDLADLDGDGDLDLLVVNDHNVPDRVHLNTGNGTFVDVSATALPANADWSVDQVVGDFDGDGDVDWLVQAASSTRLYLNDGTGVFTDVSATNLPGTTAGASGQQSGCFAADLDQDGDLDIVLPSRWGPGAIFVNQGNAVFTLLGLNLAGRFVPGDLDGDGRIDLIWADGRFRRNLGGMAFANPSNLQVQSVGFALDYDEDGDLDLISAGRVHEHDGLGNFTTRPTPGLNGLGSDMVLIDVDGDRDLDLVGPWMIATNAQRQVDSPAAPQLGQPYTVEFVVPRDSASTPVLAAVSTAGASQPIPGLGTLRLLPAAAVPLPLLMATNGGVNVTFPIPNQAGLVGLELHYQALTLDPLRPPVLGNAIRDVVQ